MRTEPKEPRPAVQRPPWHLIRTGRLQEATQRVLEAMATANSTPIEELKATFREHRAALLEARSRQIEGGAK